MNVHEIQINEEKSHEVSNINSAKQSNSRKNDLDFINFLNPIKI